ncbi:MAG: phosphatidylglycerophosphatase A family protein [Leptospirales bacterium]
MNQWHSRFNRSLCTVGGVGLLPMAPGTWCSAVALLTWMLLPERFLPFEWMAIGILLIVGVVSSDQLVRHSVIKDPPEIVIDEFVGQFISLFAVRHDIIHGLLAFIFFRGLDIVKPWPIRSVERLGGGIGIMADDVLAGLIAGILLWGAGKISFLTV